MTDITGFGAVVTLVASTTYPNALPITQFADDADSIDMPGITIAEVAMGMNGNLVSWNRANPLPLTINVVPGSEDDQNLAVLANANRVAQGKVNALDIITLNVVYPDGRQISFTGGKLVNAQFGNSISNAGRLKSKSYQFMFEKFVGI